MPRYLSLYGDLALEMFLVGDAARDVHLGCCTGYPDLKLHERVAEIEIVGLDASLPARELDRRKRTGLSSELQVLWAQDLHKPRVIGDPNRVVAGS